MRIEAIRRIFDRCWFNEATTEAGRLAPGYYYERKDDAREAGLGPNKDWSCHGADAFGLMAIAYEEPSRSGAFHRKIEYPKLGPL
jgi:phage terminase large subunit